WRRHVVDHAPFVTPCPWPRPEGWGALDDVGRALWRWRVCNENIEALAPRADRYVRLTYEDLFRGDRETRLRALEVLLDALGRPMPEDVTPLLAAAVANPAPPGPRVDVDPALVEAICGPFLARYGYGAT
ncbi:MAG: hypothetical protein KC621_31485, partial [Myxococcales bacterium]|nr:hypothetical protein [Myxococcales bacterium]